MILFLTTYWKTIAIWTLVLGVSGYFGTVILERNHYRSAYKVDQTEIQSLKDQSTALIKKHEAENTADKARYEADNKEIKDDYTKQLAAVKHRGNNGITCRVRVPQSSSSGNATTTQAETPTGTDGPTPDPVVAERVANLPADCTVSTLQVIGLQKWITEECLK
jgi:hypothetical protein